MSLSELAATPSKTSSFQGRVSEYGGSNLDAGALDPSKGSQSETASSDGKMLAAVLEFMAMVEELEEATANGSHGFSSVDPSDDGSGASDANLSTGPGIGFGPSQSPGALGGGTGGGSPDMSGVSADLSKAFSQFASGASVSSPPPGGADVASDRLDPGGSQSGSQKPSFASDQNAHPAAANAAATNNGSTDFVEGAKPGGDNITFNVTDSSNQDKDFVLTDKNDMKFAEADLKPGQSEAISVPRDAPQLESMRGQVLAPDGSLQKNPELFEGNEDPGGTFSEDVSKNNFKGDYGTSGTVSKERMEITDGKGEEEGDGVDKGTYQYSVEDQLPGRNPMDMAEDTSKTVGINLEQDAP